MATDAEAQTQLTRKRYNRIAWFYDRMESLPEVFFSGWRGRLLARAQGKILEIGVGTGKNFQYYPAGADVTGVDIADRMITIAKRKAAERGLPFRLEEGDAQDLAWPDDSFDTVVATFLFCSVPDPVKGLRELRRVVKPDGRVLLLEHVRIDGPLMGRLMDWLNPLVVRIVGANINRRTVDNVRAAGFVIEEMEHLGPMKMVKMMIARPDKARSDEGGKP
ncbi:MAG TPA: class I SAM-dependent methyltransferase [Syntrophales bacterium]|nr:class I SAM-dependent methyltransferase [Syntrophales bacterium]